MGNCANRKIRKSSANSQINQKIIERVLEKYEEEVKKSKSERSLRRNPISNEASSNYCELQNKNSLHKENEEKHRTEIMKQKGKFSLQLLRYIFTQQAKNQIPIFIDYLQEKMSEFFKDVVIEALEKMNQKKMDQTRAKVFISQNILLTNIKILQLIAAERKNNCDYQVFKNLNQSQKKILQYLKAKYPRIGISYVPEDLAEKFREFNFIEATQNDMLRGAKITFSDENEKKINLELKKMFNALIDELNGKFPVFKKFLEKEVFNPQNSQRKISSYKIGRKLPENIGKYSEDANQQFAINSPEIFRVMIKWISDLQKLILSPKQKIKQMEDFKVYMKKANGQISFENFNFYDSKNLQDLLIDLLNQASNKYKEQIADLRKELDRFNINLLRILNETQRKQKQVPQEETKVIKFAVYNSKLISWFLIRQIILIIKHLINASKKFKEQTQKTWILDLVKFDVSDLFRALISGSKNDIITVYQRLKKLEQSGEVKIVKIKNRFGQAMNDAMIIFQMLDKNSKGSFILCQLQLILAEQHGASDLIKNMDFLNHFLYELERSPFGVLSELSITLGYKDSKVRYEKKITFQKRPFNISDCKREHYHRVTFHSKQVKPILCSICSTFYMPYQCILGYEQCQLCNTYICSNLDCLFNGNKKNQRRQIIKKYEEKMKEMIPPSLKNSYSNEIRNLLSSTHDCYLVEELKKKYSQITFEDLQKILSKGEHRNTYEIKFNKKIGYFFFLIRFKGFETIINLHFWNSKSEEIENTLSKQEDYPKNNFCHSPYDLLKFVRLRQENIFVKNISIEKNNLLLFSDDYQRIKRIHQIFVCEIGINDDEKNMQSVNKYRSQQKKNAQYFSVETRNFNEKKKKQSQNVKINVNLNRKPIYLGLSFEDNKSEIELSLENKKSFTFHSIKQAREKLPELMMIKQRLHMINCGIRQTHLKSYFEQYKWKNQIKSVNFTNNIIERADIIFDALPNIQCIYLSQNNISQINIQKILKNLRKLVCFGNKIKKVSKLQNAANLTLLNLQNNDLQQFETVNLKFLLELILSSNPIQNISSIQNCGFQSLQNFDFRGLQFPSFSIFHNQLKISFPKLKKFTLTNYAVRNLNIQSSSLEYLQCRNCQIQNLRYESKQIQYLYLDGNFLKNFNGLFSTEEAAKYLKNLRIFHAPYLRELESFEKRFFPIFRSDHLKQVNLSKTDFYGDIKNIGSWDSLSLEKLSIDFSYNSVRTFPKLNFPNLKQLQLPQLFYDSIEHLQTSNLDSITALNLDGNIDIEQKMPVLKLKNVEKITLSHFWFYEFIHLDQGTLPNIQIIKLVGLSVDSIPQINYETLAELTLQYVKAKRRVSNYKIKLKQLKKLSIIGDFFSEFPLIICQQLQVLDISQENINSLKHLEECKCPNLHQLKIQNCLKLKEKSFPKIFMPCLQQLYISSCNINDFEEFSVSCLQQLKVFAIYLCEITKLPILSFPLLEQFSCSSVSQNYFQFQREEELIFLQNIENLKEWKCPSLSILDLSDNKIKKLPKISFQNLQNFYFEHNPIQDISQYEKSCTPRQVSFILQSSQSLNAIPFVQDSKYELFQMYNNQKIMSINKKQFEHFKADKLEIGGFHLQRINLSVLKNIKRLQIVESHISDIISQPKINLHNFLEIDLTDNNISSWNIFQLSSLQSLNLSRNHLKQFCIPPGKMPNLQVLIIRQNFQLEKIGKLTQSSLRKIEIGQARDLKVDFFDESVDYKQLQEIILENDFISEIQYIPSFKNCSLNQNKISSLQWISEIDTKKIQKLYFSQNKIKDIQNFQTCYWNQLEEVHFQKNNIETFPRKWLAQKLRIINFQDNQLKNIVIKQDSFLVLKQLNFSSNKIKNTNWITKDLLPSLCRLNLASNRITKFPNFEGFQRLEEIRLDFNPISNFPNLNQKLYLKILFYSTDARISFEQREKIHIKLNGFTQFIEHIPIFDQIVENESEQSEKDEVLQIPSFMMKREESEPCFLQ